MAGESELRFRGGENIAMKIPAHLFDQTIAFYRDALKLPLLQEGETGCVFQFGAMRLWLDRIPHMSQAELWLEVRTNDVTAAAEHMAGKGVTRCDAIEPLPDGFEGFWVSAPPGIIHLVAAEGA